MTFTLPSSRAGRARTWALGLVVGLGLAAASGVYWARRGRPPRSAAPEAIPIVRLKPPPDLPRPPISDLAHTDRNIYFRLRLPHESQPPSLEAPLIFVVPPDRAVSVNLKAYRVGDSAMPSNDEPLNPPSPASAGTLSPSATTLESLQAGLRLRELGVLRRWRLVALESRPEFFAPYGPSGAGLVGDLTADIELLWDEPFSPSPGPPERELDPGWGWGRVAARLVANPEGLRLYALNPPPLPDAAAAEPSPPWAWASGDRPWARLRLTEPGLYEVPVEDLLAVGFPAGRLRVEALRLFSRGEPVPLLPSLPGRPPLFWNDAQSTRYTRERVFWVTLGEDLPAPALTPYDPPSDVSPQVRTVTTRRARVDRDHKILVDQDVFLSIEDIAWVDAPLREEEPLLVPLECPAFAAGSLSLEAHVFFILEAEEDSTRGAQYRVGFYLDDQLLKVFEPVGGSRTIHRIEERVEIEPGLIGEGANRFSLKLIETLPEPGAAWPLGQTSPPSATLWFDRLEMDYPARLELVDGNLTLQDPTLPDPIPVESRLERAQAAGLEDAIALAIGPGNRPLGTVPLRPLESGVGWRWMAGPDRRVEILAPDRIRRPPPVETVRRLDLIDEASGVDYLIISHREFLDLLGPLETLHRRRGLVVRSLDVQSVYDHFSGGELSPVALRDFLAGLIGRLPAPPTYITLVGDASSDYHGLLRNDVRNWVPAYTYDSRGDHWASDHWLAAVAGADDLADFMIGRLSVARREDARAIIDKIVAYAEGPATGPWRARLAYVGDDGDFIDAVEELRRRYTPPAYAAARLFMERTVPLEDELNVHADTVARARLKASPVLTARLLRTFRDGVSFLEYYGHGSPNIWMEERVWFGGDHVNSDNRHLTGSGHPAFVVNGTCNTGAFDYPDPPWHINISEDLLRTPDGGAVALFVPSGPSVTSVQMKMSTELRAALFADGLRRLGEATTLAKARHTAHGHAPPLAYMYVLLGDPALDLAIAGPPRAFEAPRGVIQPGESLAFRLVDVQPRAGRFVASLETESGEVLWERPPARFSDGAIPIEADTPTTAPLGSAFFRLYAWDEATGKDLLASTSLKLDRAEPSIVLARGERGPSGETTLVLGLKNAKPIPWEDGRVVVSALTSHGESEVRLDHEITLAADTETTLRLPLADALAAAPSAGGAGDAQAYVVQLTSSGSAAPDAGPPLARRHVVIPPADGRVGFVPALSAWEPAEALGTIRIRAQIAAGADSGARWNVGVADEAGVPLQTKPVEMVQGTASAEFLIPLQDVSRLTSGTLWIDRPTAPALGPAARSAEMRTQQLPRPEPRLRIVPESVRVDPPDPFEGQTILIRFQLENVGSTASAEFTAALFPSDPELRPPALPSLVGPDRIRGGPIPPGGVESVLLRWDPHQNAGENVFWIGVDQGGRRGGSTREELALERRLFVRTKAHLARGKTYVALGELPDGTPQVRVLGEVVNLGQTEARNVTVVFYQSEIRIPETRLGEVVLPRVGPGERAVAQIVWEHFVPGPEPPKPIHDILLRGSLQRIIRLAPEESSTAAGGSL